MLLVLAHFCKEVFPHLKVSHTQCYDILTCMYMYMYSFASHKHTHYSPPPPPPHPLSLSLSLSPSLSLPPSLSLSLSLSLSSLSLSLCLSLSLSLPLSLSLGPMLGEIPEDSRSRGSSLDDQDEYVDVRVGGDISSDDSSGEDDDGYLHMNPAPTGYDVIMM